MVAVLHAAPGTSGPQAIAAWLAGLRGAYPEEDLGAFEAAAAYARERCADLHGRDGELLIERAIGTATILAGLKLDATTLRAALLIGLPAANAFDADDVGTRFGADAATLVAGVARMDEIRMLPDVGNPDERAAQSERLRKMLLAMVEDIRVVLIKLAERTQALRFLMTGDVRLRRDTAREVLDLFAPLANRLGIWQLKWELEDLSLRALEPDEYKAIAKMLDERRLDRQRYIETIVATLKRELAAAGIKADVTGRPKHIYSIWKKMRRKDSGIEGLYDIRAVRILVDDLKDCYAALGVVHHLWTPLSGEFDDYIAKPKANNYRSLHTAVIGPEDKPLEVQIRTYEMHQHSEYGVAAHWRYKESGQKGVRRDPAFEDRIAWLRQVLEWKDAVADASEWLTAFKSSLFTETIYVLTPQGKVIDLPRGATPVDFAYAVHTNLGHRCRGAKVDGAMVPLNHPLRNGQRVEIVTAKQGGPSRDWLNQELGYVQSHRARTKVRQWFKAQQHDETVAQGRATVERELQRAGATAVNLDAVAAKAGFDKADEFYAAVARDDVNLRQIQAAIKAVVQPSLVPEALAEPELLAKQSKSTGSGGGILVVGVDHLMTALARCCKPAPPDPIVGFVTRGRGVSIHRQRCATVARMRSREPERLIDADWGKPRDEVFPVDVVIEAMDRQGLLRDITEVLSRERINVTAANTLTRNMASRMAFTLEVRDLDQLNRALAIVRDVPGVLSAGRRSGTPHDGTAAMAEQDDVHLRALKRLGRFTARVLAGFRANQGFLLAGGVAYYTLLSILPLLILMLIALSQFVDEAQLLLTIGRYLDMVVPGQSAAFMEEVASFLAHRTVISGVLLVTLIFFSSLAFTVLENAMSVIFHHRVAIRRRHFLVSALIPYCYIMVLGIGLLLMTAMAGALQAFGTESVAVFGYTWSLGGVSGLLLYLLGVVGEVLVLTSIYLVMPVGRLSRRHALIGGATAALLWEIMRHLLVWYFATLSAVKLVYGSLATSIVVLCSLEIAAMVLLLGAQVIAEVERGLRSGQPGAMRALHTNFR